MQMCRAIGMPAEAFQQLPDRSVIGNGIVEWLCTAKPIAAIGTGREDTPQVEVGLDALLLHIVEAVVIGLPDIDRHALDWIAIGVGDAAMHKHRLALAIQRNVRAHLAWWRIGHVEGAEDGRFRSAFRFAVIDGIDEHRHAEDIGQQNVFLAPVIAGLTGRCEKLDGFEPLFFGRLNLFYGFVQFANDDVHDLAQTRVFTIRHAFGDGFDGVFFGKEGTGVLEIAGHVCSPSTNSLLRQNEKLPQERSTVRLDLSTDRAFAGRGSLELAGSAQPAAFDTLPQ